MDLNAINSSISDSFEVEIVHPSTGAGGWFLTVASPSNVDSQFKIMAILDKSRKRKNNSPQQEEKDVIAMLNARVLGWRGLTNGGEDVEFSETRSLEILSDPRSFWIRSQLIDAIGDPTRPFSS